MNNINESERRKGIIMKMSVIMKWNESVIEERNENNNGHEERWNENMK